jgi:hypothetical protein
MSLQVSLKLKLSKQIKKIKVKYNTFEKATYDEYLMASLALRSFESIPKTSAIGRLFDSLGGFKKQDERDQLVFEYIEDITGEGSLNAHFKNIYNRLKSFSKEQLNKIMESSMIPTLKIDEKKRYEYYPQLNISIFERKIYQGDLGEYSDLQEIIMIQEMQNDPSKSEQFFGLWMISKVRHSFKDQLFKTNIICTRTTFLENLAIKK